MLLFYQLRLGETPQNMKIGPAGQQTYRAIVLINPAATAAAATAILPNL